MTTFNLYCRLMVGIHAMLRRRVSKAATGYTIGVSSNWGHILQELFRGEVIPHF